MAATVVSAVVALLGTLLALTAGDIAPAVFLVTVTCAAVVQYALFNRSENCRYVLFRDLGAMFWAVTTALGWGAVAVVATLTFFLGLYVEPDVWSVLAFGLMAAAPGAVIGLLIGAIQRALIRRSYPVSLEWLWTRVRAWAVRAAFAAAAASAFQPEHVYFIVILAIPLAWCAGGLVDMRHLEPLPKE